MFAVDTHCILPHYALQPYVKYFAIRSFDTGEETFHKPMIADHEMTMVFFIRTKLFGFDAVDKILPPYSIKANIEAECCFTGIQTFTKGHVIFKGQSTILNIHFTPTGFFHIFNIKPSILMDKMDDCIEILSNEILTIQGRMQESSIPDCVDILQQYLMAKISSRKPKYTHEGIVGAADFLVKHKGMYPIQKLAFHCNMTIQTFEVQFTEQVGLNPKYYSRVLRFGRAVNIKLYHPGKSWGEIANTCGYFDQNHFVKECKEFSFLTPGKFSKSIKLPLESYQGINNIF